MAEYIFTGKPCKRGHIGPRLKSSRACCECQKESNRIRYAADPEGTKVRVQQYREANPEKIVHWHRNWREANIEQERERDKRRFLADRESHIARLNAWDAANPGRSNAKSAKHRAAKLQRTPPWADLDATEGMYELARVFRRVGLQIEVDHIVPLQGKKVSGLHVADNLQLIHSIENKSKSNRFAIL